MNRREFFKRSKAVIGGCGAVVILPSSALSAPLPGDPKKIIIRYEVTADPSHVGWMHTFSWVNPKTNEELYATDWYGSPKMDDVVWDVAIAAFKRWYIREYLKWDEIFEIAS